MKGMRELTSLCEGDTLCLWLAQNLGSGSVAWRSDGSDAVAVAGPNRSGRNRLTFYSSSVGASQDLAREVVEKINPSYRLLGSPQLVEAIAGVVPRLTLVEKSFGWMDRRADAEPPSPSHASWLAESDGRAIMSVIDDGFPESYARPGVDGEMRWAGVRDDSGQLGAVAALAWSTPQVGLVAGVATSTQCRGRGMGYQVCDFVVRSALADYGAVALMVEHENRAARSLYEKLGLSYRPLSAAFFDDV